MRNLYFSLSTFDLESSSISLLSFFTYIARNGVIADGKDTHSDQEARGPTGEFSGTITLKSSASISGDNSRNRISTNIGIDRVIPVLKTVASSKLIFRRAELDK